MIDITPQLCCACVPLASRLTITFFMVLRAGAYLCELSRHPSHLEVGLVSKPQTKAKRHRACGTSRGVEGSRRWGCGRIAWASFARSIDDSEVTAYPTALRTVTSNVKEIE